MLPRDLRIEHFRAYPPKAAKLAVDSLPALRRLPLSFLPSLLREVIEYDYKFPAERAALEKEVAKLVSLSDSQVAKLFGGFSKITLSAQLESSDWVSSPAQFVCNCRHTYGQFIRSTIFASRPRSMLMI